MVKKKTTKKKVVAKKLTPAILKWKFPQKQNYVLKIEAFFVAFLSIFILVFLYYQFGQSIVPAIISTILFLVVYFVVTIIIKHFRRVEENYNLSKTHLEIKTKVNGKSNVKKLYLKDIILYKLDKFFLGAYVLTKEKKRHPIYFNSKHEVEKVEKHLKKHVKIKK